MPSRFAYSALGVSMVAALSGCPAYLGIYEFPVLDARSSAGPSPVAPPPAQANHVMDLTLRETGATRTSGSELGSHPETGMHPLRTDGAVSVRVGRFFSLRLIGSLGYGDPIGTVRDLPFPDRASATGGLGVVVGYWGDPDWSLVIELDGSLVALDNRSRFRTAIGPCYSIPFGDEMVCTPERYVGAPSFYQGMHIAPNVGLTLDVAGMVTRWLRVGGGASLQANVSRGMADDLRWQPVGIARFFAELHYEDVWLGFEAQQWIVENVAFAPSLGISVGGALFEPPGPDEPEPVYPEDDPGNTDRPAPPSLVLVPPPPASTYGSDGEPEADTEPAPSIPWLNGVAP